MADFKKKYKKSMKAFSVFLILNFAITAMLAFTACGKKEPEAEEPPEEETVYGDKSLGIDARVDEELRDYRSIALLGIDAGGRSDMMMVMTINEKDSKAKIVAVHRDTYMQIAEDGTYNINGVEREFYKCNRAYKRDGKYGTMKELNRHMDLNIKECIAIDWEGVSNLVDNLGGIEVDVTASMLPYVNGLISGKGDKIASAGFQNINGTQAVAYLRCRKDPGSDATTRDERNQAVFKALYDKAKGMDIGEISEIYDKIADDLDTNMSRTTLTETLALIASTDLEETEGWPYEYDIMWEEDDSFYYFVPNTLESNVIELHKTLFGQEDYKPSETLLKLNDRIIELKEEQLH